MPSIAVHGREPSWCADWPRAMQLKVMIWNVHTGYADNGYDNYELAATFLQDMQVAYWLCADRPGGQWPKAASLARA